MNKKKFFKVFAITTAILLVLFAGACFAMSFYSNIGGGEEVEELDRAVSNSRENIIVFGTDESGLRSDVIMIFSFLESEGSINLVSIPRDTRVKIGNSYEKINAALAIGKESLAIQTVKQLTGIPIHDYVTVNFEAVRDIVDAVGGVDFDVPQDMNYDDPAQNLHIHLKKGMQHLNGDQALQLLRFRSYPMADLTRNEVQQNFIKAMFEQKAKPQYIAKIPEIYAAVNQNVRSSMSLAEITSYANRIRKSGVTSIQNFELPGEPKHIGGGDYVINDPEKTAELMEQYFK